MQDVRMSRLRRRGESQEVSCVATVKEVDWNEDGMDECDGETQPEE